MTGMGASTCFFLKPFCAPRPKQRKYFPKSEAFRSILGHSLLVPVPQIASNYTVPLPHRVSPQKGKRKMTTNELGIFVRPLKPKDFRKAVTAEEYYRVDSEDVVRPNTNRSRRNKSWGLRGQPSVALTAVHVRASGSRIQAMGVKGTTRPSFTAPQSPLGLLNIFRRVLRPSDAKRRVGNLRPRSRSERAAVGKSTLR